MDRRAFGLAGLALAVAASPAGANIASGTGSRLIRADELPYEPPATLALIADLYSRMTAPLKVQGQGPFHFVVDTGANQSVISAELASRLGLPLGPPALLNGVAGSKETPTTIATLTIGPRLRRDVRLFVLPEAAIGAAGMIGLDGLEGQRLILDFQEKAMRIEAPTHQLGGGVSVRSRRRDGQLTLVDADIAGIPVTAFIDSGAQNTIGNRALQALARARRPTELWRNESIVSVTGQTIDAEMADLPRLRLGGMSLPVWPVAFADLHTFQMWKLIDAPAMLVGVDVLSRFERVSLDFAHDEVRFTPPDVDRVVYRASG
jgi:hypothetical protein